MLASLRSMYTTHGSFKLQKRWAKLLYQILSICQDKGRKGRGAWVVYIHVLITTVQLFQKTRRNRSYRIKALWSGRRRQVFRKGEGTCLEGGGQWEIQCFRRGPADFPIWQRPKLCRDWPPPPPLPECLQESGLERLVPRGSSQRK